MDALYWLAGSSFVSIGAGFLVAWAVRLAPSAKLSAYALNDVSKAYLFGGRRRAREIALYNLLRDGWISAGADGVFTARFRDAAQDMNVFERELLAKIAERGGATIHDVANLELAGFADVERHLLRKRLIVDVKRLPHFDLAPRILLGINLLFAVKLGGEAYIRHEPFLAPLIIAAFLWGAVKVINASYSHRTTAGEKLFRHLSGEISKRSRARSETDVAGHHYDRLWSLHDDVLTKGFRSLVGSAVLPSIVEQKTSAKSSAVPELSYERRLSEESENAGESAS